ncbi:protein FAR1-RELATED SEQUENCE 6-like isoform X2 [Cynara cardunculus var. scolymus]|uniref:protein FAR1-RELATED SEQUENCE 6-like isoform X2 n=1 Tax=Cynara cardunculus var. scolymus TaxID=59895 RepID=UPI000D62EB63|nr:protein FAR1-RELATED SEQUENCE 6-like isoform X2 [Cynara cardunculus var. scolymus]
MNKMYQSTTWLHYSGTNCDDETWFPNASVHLFWKLFPPKTTCITLTLALLNGWWSPRTFSMINLENPWEILDGFIKVRRSPWINQSALPLIQHNLPSEMVNINEFPSDGTMNSNGSDRSNFRTPIIRNEMENEDRVLYSGNTLAGDGEAEIPVIGMTFNSFEEVREFYGKYAAGKGFDIITRSTKSDVEGKIKYYTLACSRSGKAVCTRKCHLLSKSVVKTNCKARINIRTSRDGKLYLSGFTSEHNHELSHGNSSCNTCTTSLGPHLERLVEYDDQVETQVNNNFQLLASNENLHSRNEEIINYIARSGSLRLGEGDIESIFDYFVHMQKQDTNFFYVSNMNEECCLRNVFWADGRSQALYESFGDVVAFESTYLNSDYKLPLVSIVGVNHHGQLILLGCGILFDDDKESYMWLFRSWLKCVCGRPPKAIVTNQCPSVQAAVSEVFPETRNRLCLQDIMRTISLELCGLTNYLAIKNALESSVLESCTIEEFEESWNLFIKELKLENNDRLRTLYLDRAKWVPAFLKTTFWAGLSSANEQNENVNGFFDGHILPETTLKQFMDQFNAMLRSKIEKEEHADSISSSFVIPTITDFPLEKQFQDAYTNEMFKLFQEELIGLIYCNASLVSSEGPKLTFEVKDHARMKDGSRRKVVYEVIFDDASCNVWCKCCLFESQGILCRHAVAVLVDQDVNEVPSCYILSRWRKDVNRMHKGVSSCNEVLKSNEQMVCLGKLRTACHSIVEIGAETEEGFELALNLLDEVKERMFEHKSESSRNNEEPSGSSAKDGEAAKHYGEELQRSLVVRRRGRPPTKKKKVHFSPDTWTNNPSARNNSNGQNLRGNADTLTFNASFGGS